MRDVTSLVPVLVLGLGLISCQAAPVPDPLSADAGLFGLAVDGLALSADGGGAWGRTVANATTSVTLTCALAIGATAAIGAESGTSFVLDGLIEGPNPFSITVTAQDGVAKASYTLVITRDPPVLPEVIALSAPGDAQIEVDATPLFSWERSTGAVRWKIFMGDGTLPPDLPASGWISTPTWKPAGALEPLLTYAWKVVPYDLAGLPLVASEVRTFTTGTAPAVPAGFAVSRTTNAIHLELTWTPTLHAKSYLIYRNGAPDPVAVIEDGSAFAWVDRCPNTGLNSYALKAANSFGSSAATMASGTPAASGSGIVIIK